MALQELQEWCKYVRPNLHIHEYSNELNCVISDYLVVIVHTSVVAASYIKFLFVVRYLIY